MVHYISLTKGGHLSFALIPTTGMVHFHIVKLKRLMVLP